uniref:Uncharacterized protein n=1 Tax=Eutreptiella gymnastica TaxID=73025 RepID=A0A7S4CUG8_9EUGL
MQRVRTTLEPCPTDWGSLHSPVNCTSCLYKCLNIAQKGRRGVRCKWGQQLCTVVAQGVGGGGVAQRAAQLCAPFRIGHFPKWLPGSDALEGEGNKSGLSRTVAKVVNAG